MATDRSSVTVARLRERGRPGTGSWDGRTLVLAGTCLLTGTGALALLTTGGLTAADAALLIEVSAVTALVAGGWSLLRRRLRDAECALVLVVTCAVACAQTLAYESETFRWACVYGMAGLPMIGLMLTGVRWAAVVTAACMTAQLVVVVGIARTPVEMAVSVAIVTGGLPLFVGYTAVLLRRSEALRAQAEHAANVDHLTGLLNRRALRQRSAGLLRRAREEGNQLAALLLDIDHFKRINDSYGHDAGDAVLATLGTHLRDWVRSEDLLVRLGGEELVGVAVGAHGGAGEDPHEVVGRLPTRADGALYRAKASGRDCVAVAGPDRRAQVIHTAAALGGRGRPRRTTNPPRVPASG